MGLSFHLLFSLSLCPSLSYHFHLFLTRIPSVFIYPFIFHSFFFSPVFILFLPLSPLFPPISVEMMLSFLPLISVLEQLKEAVLEFNLNFPVPSLWRSCCNLIAIEMSPFGREQTPSWVRKQEHESGSPLIRVFFEKLIRASPPRWF